MLRFWVVFREVRQQGMPHEHLLVTQSVLHILVDQIVGLVNSQLLQRLTPSLVVPIGP